MTVIPDVLRKAADIIDSNGWCQSHDVDRDTGGLCANGAIRVALGHVIERDDRGFDLKLPGGVGSEQFIGCGRAIKAAHLAVGAYMDTFGVDAGQAEGPLPPLVRFNDAVATGPEQVTKLMRDAAAWIESGPVAELQRVADILPDTATDSNSNYVLVDA